MKVDSSAPGGLRDGLIWIWALLPAVAWAIQFETIYVLAPPDRQPRHVGAIRAVSFIALLTAATATWQAYADLHRRKRVARPSERRRRPALWLASAAIGIGLFFCVVIIATALVTWFVSPQD